MIKKKIIITVAILSVCLISCRLNTDEQAVSVGINFSFINHRIKDASLIDILEQATSSDIVDSSEVEDENIVNIEINVDTESEVEENIEKDTSTNIEIDTESINNFDLSEENLSENESQMKEDQYSMNMVIKIGDMSFDCTLYENETTYAFIEQLPLTITMNELNGNEKYYYLENSLPTNSSSPNKIHTGELMLFGTDCLVLFYEDFNTSYSYTSIGYVNEPNQLADVLGRGSVQVVFEIK